MSNLAVFQTPPILKIYSRDKKTLYIIGNSAIKGENILQCKQMKLPLYLIATLLFGLKTYIIYRLLFNLDLENLTQELLLVINPFVSSFLIFSVSIWFKKESQQIKFLLFSVLIGTLILYANLIFYRANTDFITILHLFQASNFRELGSSILTLIKTYDVFLFIDLIIIWSLIRRRREILIINLSKSEKVLALAMSFILLIGNFILAEIERPQLFTRTFDREYLVKNIGVFNYHVYDAIMQFNVKAKQVFADESELPQIVDYIKDKQGGDKSELFGVAKDKNLIFISVESLQSFVINNEVSGEDITPFLNSLTEDEDTFYFENFYSQIAQGRTSDSEFLVENSLYPLSSGAVFFTHSQNEYNALPELLKEKGYYNSVFHANNKSFWNRDQMYKSLGYDQYFGKSIFDISENNSVGWGLKDKEFFEQSIELLKSFKQPFYTKFITLTNHFPFDLNENDRTIDPYNSNSETLNKYFTTVRYTDEALEMFFKLLKDTGIYKDSIIVIMGDHFGISENHNKAMSQYLGKEEITSFDQIQLQRVPLFIHIPGIEKGELITEIAGQIDIKPTLLNLLGIELDKDIYFGNNLFSNERKNFIALRNGDFISEKYISTGNKCYNRRTGELLERIVESDFKENNKSPCDPIQDKVLKELRYSDEIIYGDLIRFIDIYQK